MPARTFSNVRAVGLWCKVKLEKGKSLIGAIVGNAGRVGFRLVDPHSCHAPQAKGDR